jgi:phosphatidylserine/phosphatidylglycerophosphate/cardiolipin synthase-like enzyme
VSPFKDGRRQASGSTPVRERLRRPQEPAGYGPWDTSWAVYFSPNGGATHAILDANAQPHRPPISAVARLVAAGIVVSLDAQHAWAHDKLMILDGEIVITGSYNWTVAAEKQNGENLLVIRDRRLAGVYTENWRRHAHHSTSYRATTPWWVRIRVIWVSLTCKRPKRLDSEIGADC